MVEMIRTSINGKYELFLPEHRAARPEWGKWTDDQGTEHFGWEVERLDSLHQNIGPGDVVYDIGTEEGDLSALIASWIGQSDGGICLFEPNDRVWANIFVIWTANDLKPPLACVQGFAGDENRHLSQLDITTFPESALGPVISDHGFVNLPERPDIPAIRLDDFMQMVGAAPSVINIDVEGAELRVLVGASEILETIKPVVFLSVHDAFMRGMYHETPQHLYEYMGDLGYRSKILEEDHELHVAFYHPYGRELRW